MGRNIWLDGVMGVIIGDALGCPVQFMERSEIKDRGLVTGMEGYGTYNMPPGTWTDDGSMTLALLASIRDKGAIELTDIMDR
ncbi:MAG: ADP-ribosylglycohydrolase family protein, partial [Butyrivibrio sp.]|nr:ADP-ribosylglycohydrolase family protein [Butyrivibrio sp.]